MIHIVSKGVLVESSKVYFDSDANEDNDPTTVVYSFTPSFRHAPKAAIIAYYVNKKGDFVTTQVFVLLERNLPNYVRFLAHDWSWPISTYISKYPGRSWIFIFIYFLFIIS